MNIKSKLSLSLIILAFIPFIIINIIYSSNILKSNQKSYEYTTRNITNVKADNLNFYLEDSLRAAKNIAGIDAVRKFMQFADSDLYRMDHIVGKEFQPIFNSVLDVLNYAVCIDNTIELSLMVNNYGDIVASTDSNLNNLPLSNAEDIIKVINETKNELSGLTTVNIEGVRTPVFCISKDIYSADNTLLGKYYQINNTLGLQNVLNANKPYETSNEFIIDSYGNVFAIPFYNVSPYYQAGQYSAMVDYIDNVIKKSSEEYKGEFGTVQVNSSELYLFNDKIDISNWNLIVSAEKNEISGSYRSDVWNYRITTFLIFLVQSIIIIIFSTVFSKPIEHIVEILQRKQRGENVRFIAQGEDDFAEIGRAFNKMFDDVIDSEQRYRTIVEMTDNIVFEVNFKKNNVFVSNNFNQKFSFRPKSDNFQDSFFYQGRIHKDDKEKYRRDFDRIINEDTYMQGEYRFKNIYGDFVWILIRATKFFDRNDCPTKIIGVIVDIDKEKKSEMKLLQKASYDALTQLYNRDTFLKTLQNEFELSQMRKSRDAVLFIDLDDFKHFNDEYGHACGDEVLKFTADCIREIVFDKGFAGRFGGDEFVITLINQNYYEEPGEIAKEIIDALQKGFISESTGKQLFIKCSIGIAFFMETGKNCEEIIELADEAMYSIKKHGKSDFGYFSVDEGLIPHKPQKEFTSDAN